MHLITANLSKNVNYNESSFASRGKNMVDPVDSPIGKIGMSVCYDLRFPYLFYQSAYKGAEVFLSPANFPTLTGIPHWEVLLRARAIENTCYVAAANLAGKFHYGIAHGHSLVIDPWGKVLLDMKDEVGIGFANIDINYLREIRKKLPCLTHQQHHLAQQQNTQN